MSAHEEIIGYVTRDSVEEASTLPNAGILPDPSRAHYEHLLALLAWDVRGPLEEDPTKKQLIPYIVVTQTEHVWVMRRKRAQSEARLHDKLSIGVGGHLDEAERHADDPIIAGARREFAEEVEVLGELDDEALDWSYLGLLNDDRNAVGEVHLGVVFHLKLAPHLGLEVRERDKIEGEWVHWEALNMERLETWSQLVAEVIKS